MFSKQEASTLKKKFWTAFGHYIKPIPSADGEKINWINYKTGVKNIAFWMDVSGKKAFVAIEISHADLNVQQLYFEQFLAMKKRITEAVGKGWNWQLHTTNEMVKTISSISISLGNVSLLNKNDWPALISFFKTYMIALDDFWSEAKYGFETMSYEL